MQATGIDLLLQALDVSLDRRKLGLAVLGFVAAGIIGGLFIGLGIAIGNDAALIVLGLLGLIGVWVVSALFTGAIAKLSYEDLAGRQPLSIGDALRYAANRLTGLMFAPLLLWILLIAAGIAEAIVLLLGRVPAVGPVLSALLFLPIVLINVFLLLFVLFGGWLVPAIIAGEGTSTMDTLSRLRTIVRQAPGRVFTYLALTMLLTLILGLVLLTLVSIATTQTQVLSFAAGFGGSFFAGPFGPDPMQLLLGPMLRFFGPFGGFGGFGLAADIAGLLYAVAGLLLTAIVVAIPYFIFPIASACAAHISVMGGAPAPRPVPQPAHQPTPAQQPAAAQQQPPAQPQIQQPQPPGGQPQQQPPPAQQQPSPQPQAQQQQAPGGTQYCSQCGAQLRTGATFCGQCGEPVT